MRQLVVGDIHGANKALLQVLERCNYDPSSDQIIFLGDYVDGWSESYDVIETILKLQKESHLGNIHILGNHDKWFDLWIDGHPHNWTHGALNTIKSYALYAGIEDLEVNPYKVIDAQGYLVEHYDVNISADVVPNTHKEFLKSLQLYHRDDYSGRFFVHAGFNRFTPIDMQEESIFYWDRNLFYDANSGLNKISFEDGFREVYIGHTPTFRAAGIEPIILDNVVCVDTGAAFTGKLTIIDADTKEYWQSDLTQTLYPFETGRN